jgi:hypothetical protein
MATREQARLALVNKVEALKASWAGGYTLEVEYDNLERVNLATQTDPYLCVNLLYHDGYQLDLSDTPQHRLLGTIVLEAKVKEGQGSKKASELLDHFYKALHLTDANAPLRTEAAKIRTPPAHAGWKADVAIIPFWFDSAA